MEPVFISSAFACLVVAAGLAFSFRRLTATELPTSADWISNISVGRYRAMQSLLDEDNYAFLAKQPKCDRRMARRFRSRQRRIFRQYLRSLTLDYSQVCGALRMIISYSAQDRRDLAVVLYKQQARFAFGLLAVQWHLALHVCGSETVDVRRLLRVFESMREQLQQFVPVASAAAA